jgi:GT2 family glycosyltransferase
VAFFCVMMPRRVYEAVGPLDEQFFPGFFEDDDYCLRVREKGWTIGCAEDVFVYHELSASFDAEGAARRAAIFERNKALFEKKWGPWKPHIYREESLPRP